MDGIWMADPPWPSRGWLRRAARRGRMGFQAAGHRNPSLRHQNPNPPHRNPSPAQQNPNAFSFRESRFLNGLNVDSGRLEDNCDSTGQATSPCGPFARVLSEKLNHRRGDLARKCRFEVFPKKRPLPKQAANPFDRSGAGQWRALRDEPFSVVAISDIRTGVWRRLAEKTRITATTTTRARPCQRRSAGHSSTTKERSAS